jgi:UDPglucose--hexose-1-phosphate uridylyltransferase
MIALDIIHGGRIAFSSSRAKRPHKPKGSPFAKGNEHLTPPHTLILPNQNWRVRCFPNAFPVLSGKQGRHEVIVETDRPKEKWENFSETHLALLFSAYQQRFRALSKNKNAKYVLLFKNFGDKSGASIVHEHSQIISFPFVPNLIANEIKAGDEPFKKLLREPALLQSPHFKVVCPSASRFAWETWIVARDSALGMEIMNEKTGLELMVLLQKIIRKIKTFSPHYTLVWHAAPAGKKLHFHVEILPRKSVWGGIELGAGVLVNFKKPKDALKDLSGI